VKPAWFAKKRYKVLEVMVHLGQILQFLIIKKEKAIKEI
jgi:hypothetical protein